MNDIIPLSPSFPAADRIAAALASAKRNLAEATWHALENDAKVFRCWCDSVGLSPAAPIAPEMIARFLRAESDAGRAVATVRRRAATLAKLHKMMDLPNPCASSLVTDELRGIARDRGTDQRQATGLTQRDADKIVGRVASRKARMRDLRDLAVLLVGRDLLARASELVSLTVESISWKDNGTALVAVRRHKTSTETMTYPLGVDAASALKRWLEASGVATGPTFRSLTKGGRVKPQPIGVRDVGRIIKALAGQDYSAHSLRVGMAQDLVAENFATAAIMQAGGWKSPEMVARYTSRIDAERGAVAQFHARRGKL